MISLGGVGEWAEGRVRSSVYVNKKFTTLNLCSPQLFSKKHDKTTAAVMMTLA